MYKLKFEKTGNNTEVYRKLTKRWEFSGVVTPTNMFIPSLTCPYTVAKSFYDRGYTVKTTNYGGRELCPSTKACPSRS